MRDRDPEDDGRAQCGRSRGQANPLSRRRKSRRHPRRRRVASRLEGICEPGGACHSSSGHEQVRGRVEVEFVDLGEQVLKNIARPARAYALSPEAFASTKVEAPDTANASAAKPVAPERGVPPRLSIVVLPLANIGGDPEQEYFVDRLTDILTTALSRISGAFVIARNTAFTYKGKAVDLKQIGRDLNVRYVLEGSVQRAAPACVSTFS
jgi:hypothetical protein